MDTVGMMIEFNCESEHVVNDKHDEEGAKMCVCVCV